METPNNPNNTAQKKDPKTPRTESLRRPLRVCGGEGGEEESVTEEVGGEGAGEVGQVLEDVAGQWVEEGC